MQRNSFLILKREGGLIICPVIQAKCEENVIKSWCGTKTGPSFSSLRQSIKTKRENVADFFPSDFYSLIYFCFCLLCFFLDSLFIFQSLDLLSDTGL